MFALYRKVQDYADDDGEERQSLKASTSEREEPADPRFVAAQQHQAPRLVQQGPVPLLGKPHAPKHRATASATQQDHFDPFSDLAGTRVQSASAHAPSLQVQFPQQQPPAHPQQQLSDFAAHSFDDLLTRPDVIATAVASASPGSQPVLSHAPVQQHGLAGSTSPSTQATGAAGVRPLNDLAFPRLESSTTAAATSGPGQAAHAPADSLVLPQPSTPTQAQAGPTPQGVSHSTGATPAHHGLPSTASEPCFIHESDWDLLTGPAPKASASALAPATAAATRGAQGAGPAPAQADWAELEDLFSGVEGASAPVTAHASSSPGTTGAAPADQPATDVTADAQPEQGPEGPRTGSGADDEAPGQHVEPRELLLYAIPLIKDRLVFLPVTAWQVDPEVDKQGFTGAVKTGLNKVTGSVVSWWNSFKDKDPDSIGHKMYQHGQVIINNMSAEERLMQNIPRNAQKLVVHHPAVIDPSQVMEQLEKMTATYCVKSMGKAAVAGVILPVAVGLEIIAVPGAGWIALYQLYKNSVSAAGGQRLKSYLNRGGDVRVNFAGDPRLDKYVDRVDNSAEGVLTDEDIEELCHDVQESTLNHPLQELRNRFIRRHVQHKSDYAALPDSDTGAEEPQSLYLTRGAQGERGEQGDGRGVTGGGGARSG